MNEWLYQSAWLVPTLPCFAGLVAGGGLASSAQGNAQPSRVALGLPDGEPSHINGPVALLSAGPARRIWILSLGNGLDSLRAPALAGGLSSRSLERDDACTYHDGGFSCHGI